MCWPFFCLLLLLLPYPQRRYWQPPSSTAKRGRIFFLLVSSTATTNLDCRHRRGQCCHMLRNFAIFAKFLPLLRIFEPLLRQSQNRKIAKFQNEKYFRILCSTGCVLIQGPPLTIFYNLNILGQILTTF